MCIIRWFHEKFVTLQPEMAWYVRPIMIENNKNKYINKN